MYGWNPYGMPPPPYNWAQGPTQQIPIPPGVDPLKAMEFMDRVYRRAEKKKEKEKEPKKDEKKKDTVKDLIWYFQAACVLYFLSPPIAALQHLISTLAEALTK